MTKHLQQCMGGWCTRREKCAHYWAKPTENVPPADRLCVNLTLEQEERERMAADPRFAAWVAGQPENQGEEA